MKSRFTSKVVTAIVVLALGIAAEVLVEQKAHVDNRDNARVGVAVASIIG